MSRAKSPKAAAEEARLMDALVELSFAVQDLLGTVAAKYGVSVTQARLLGILRDREPAMGDLREHLGLEKSSVTGLIDRAERRGLVTRISGHSDGRAVHVRLTAPGAELATRFAAEVYASLETLLGTLPASDCRRLANIAEALLTRQLSRLTSDSSRTEGGAEDL